MTITTTEKLHRETRSATCCLRARCISNLGLIGYLWRERLDQVDILVGLIEVVTREIEHLADEAIPSRPSLLPRRPGYEVQSEMVPTSAGHSQSHRQAVVAVLESALHHYRGLISETSSDGMSSPVERDSR